MSQRVTHRVYAEGDWISEAALHTGAERDDHLDMVDTRLLRDGDGAFYVSATSLAGAARNYVRRINSANFEDYRENDDPEAVANLFGGVQHKGFASLLVTRDAYAAGGATATIRDGVRIDAKSRSAVRGAKYDREVLPAGTRLRLRFELTLFDNDRRPLQTFLQMLNGFEQGRIALGARTRRGFGAGRVHGWDVLHELDMGVPEHVNAWLTRRPEAGNPLSTVPAAEQLRPFRIEAGLRLRTSLLVRSASEQPGAPDLSQLTENGASILPGTSLAGVLRHRVARIANTLGFSEKAVDIVDSMFGPLREKSDRRPLRASRVRVSENKVEAVDRLVQGRVRIDRFTGGAAETALFDEAAIWPAVLDKTHLQVVIEIEDVRHQCEIALLLLAFKDLWLGDLAVGGESGGGRGVWEGVMARITTSAGDQVVWDRDEFGPAGGLKPTNLTPLETLFQNWPACIGEWDQNDVEKKDDADNVPTR